MTLAAVRLKKGVFSGVVLAIGAGVGSSLFNSDINYIFQWVVGAGFWGLVFGMLSPIKKPPVAQEGSGIEDQPQRKLSIRKYQPMTHNDIANYLWAVVALVAITAYVFIGRYTPTGKMAVLDRWTGDQYMGSRYYPNPQKDRETDEVVHKFEEVVNPWENSKHEKAD